MNCLSRINDAHPEFHVVFPLNVTFARHSQQLLCGEVKLTLNSEADH